MWFFALLFSIAVFCFEAFTFSGLWNAFVPKTFDGPTLTFYTSVLLLVLVSFPFTSSELRLHLMSNGDLDKDAKQIQNVAVGFGRIFVCVVTWPIIWIAQGAV